MFSVLCLVRGVGDVGSAVAHVLFGAGHRVIVHDGAMPMHTRRGMSFADAMFDGTCELESVRGKLARDPDDLPYMARCSKAIPVTCDEFRTVLESLRPEVIVDARMRKRAQPERQLGLAPLTIGLGPNFVAGETTDLVVETQWGDELGRVIAEGSSRPLAGGPRALGGYGRERYVHAPAAGLFRTRRRIGERVDAGEVIAMLGAAALVAPLRGCIRGLTHDGVSVDAGTKVIEIDPRDRPSAVFGLGERPRRIAGGVLAVVSR